MKNYLTALSTMSMLMTAFAAYNPEPAKLWPLNVQQNLSSYRVNGSYSRYVKNQWVGDLLTTGEEKTNRTTSDGTLKFMRGMDSGWEDDVTTLYIDHDMTGYLSEINNNANNANYQAMRTEVHAQGSTLASSTRAIVIGDHHSNNRQGGNWFLVGGTYYGGANNEVLYARKMGSLAIDGASFIAGKQSQPGEAKSGVYVASATSFTYTNTKTNDAVFQATEIVYGGDYTKMKEVQFDPPDSDPFQIQAANANGGSGLVVSTPLAISITGGAKFIGSQIAEGASTRTAINVQDGNADEIATARGGDGATLLNDASITDGTYEFIAGDAGNAVMGGINSYALATGGNGAHIDGTATLENSTLTGGNAGSAMLVNVRIVNDDATGVTESSKDGKAYASGGNGLLTSGTATLSYVTAYGGSGGSATAHDTGSYADASGGNGFQGKGGIITGGHFEGGKGGNSQSINGEAYAFGGSGVLATGDTTINGGTFIGAKGGTVNGEKATDGAGVKIINANLTINEGTFKGTGEENDSIGNNLALWLDNSSLTVSSNSSAIINDNILITGIGDSKITILDGTIAGDIYSANTATTTVTVAESAATFAGAFNQYIGKVDVKLTASDDAKFFNEVNVLTGEFGFSDHKATTATGSVYSLYTADSSLKFNAGVDLSDGTTINAGVGIVNVNGGDLVMGDNSRITLLPDLSSTSPQVTISGNLVATNSDAKLVARAIAPNAAGTKQLVSYAGADFGSNNIDDMVDVNFGWLTQTSSIDTNNGITANWEYNSLESRTNTTYKGLNANLLAVADGVITSDTNGLFHAMNSLGDEVGTQSLRYSLSQAPDVADTAFQINRGISGQLATRSSDFRAQNGFASTQTAPAGVAGPTSDKGMQGWIRAYAITGDRGVDGTFSKSESSAFGTIVGVDKSFGNLLIGLSGGYGSSDIEGESTYETDTDIYHGSIYSTVAGETTFLDLSLTYAQMETEELGLRSGSFDAMNLSGYLGAGKVFKLSDRLTITPEASMLASLYDQEAYTGTSIFGQMAVAAYDEMSYLGSIGASFSTMQSIEVLNQGIAYSPELRLHWQHEFNSEVDNGSYTVAGATGPQPLYVRAREEDFLRVGLGIDMWHWRYQNTKFEFDYDGLFSDDSDQHTISGKIAVQF